MFENLTPPEARNHGREATDEEIWGFGHQYIGTEHILLALVNDASSIGGKILKTRGIDLGMVRREVEDRVGREPVTNSKGKLPLTSCAMQVVEHAVGDVR